jgi:DNA-binding NarL/FixJ family response regulator
MDHVPHVPELQAIRVLVADSTHMTSQLVADALRRDRHLEVCAPDAHEILAGAMRSKPQVALISGNLPEGTLDTFRLVRQLKASHHETQIVILLDCSTRSLVVEAFRAGAKGIFCRAQSIDALIKCIHSVHQGQIWANSNEMQFLLEALVDAPATRIVDAKGVGLLTKREREVVRWVAQGFTNRDIAGRLELSEHTVKNYLFHIFDKLGVSSRAEVILYAMSQATSFRPSASIPGDSFDNDTAAFQWYQKMAERHDLAQFKLAQMYRDGSSVPKDNVAAYQWFVVAEGLGNTVRQKSRAARKQLKTKMDLSEVVEAQRRAVEWMSQHQVIPEPQRSRT